MSSCVRLIQLITLLLSFSTGASAFAGEVEIKSNQLWIDGQAQGQIFGVELEYYRLRGGTSANRSPERVLELWNKALDRAQEMQVNAVSFAIPWDFHEYAPGKFDFDGTADVDGDGRPDEPARNLKGFLELVESRGIRHILLRPGPILEFSRGFAANDGVPSWFRRQFPLSEMRGPGGERLDDLNPLDANLLKHARLWFAALHAQVLAPYIGAGRPVSFLQLGDGSALARHALDRADFSAASMTGYRAFLKSAYLNLDRLNRAHARKWKSFDDVVAPIKRGVNLSEDRDWQRFHDQSRFVYVRNLRKIWESLGVKEPQVLFTLAESGDSVEGGLMTNHRLLNEPGESALMTVELRPRSAGSAGIDRPFKIDHDLRLAESATDFYLGRPENWLMGTVDVGAGLPSYLGAIGHGLKAIFLRGFHAGDGPTADGAADSILDSEAEPRAAFAVVKELGERFVSPQGPFLGASAPIIDPVCLIVDPVTRRPIPYAQYNLASEKWSAGLMGLLLEAGVNPAVLQWRLSPQSEFNRCRLFVIQDLGTGSEDLNVFLKSVANKGAGVISMVDARIFNSLTGGAGARGCDSRPTIPGAANLQRCKVGNGWAYYLSTPLYAELNSSRYGSLEDIGSRRAIVSLALADLDLKSSLSIAESEGRAVAFGLRESGGERVLVTVKNAQTRAFRGRVRWSEAKAEQWYSVTRQIDDVSSIHRGRELLDRGFYAGVAPESAEAFMIAPTEIMPQKNQ